MGYIYIYKPSLFLYASPPARISWSQHPSPQDFYQGAVRRKLPLRPMQWLENGLEHPESIKDVG